MIIEGILNSLTKEVINREIEVVESVEFPPNIKKWTDEYNFVGGRGDYLWKWLYIVNSDWNYISTYKKYRDSLTEIKQLYNMFVVLLDDIAETHKQRLLVNLLRLPEDDFTLNGSKLSKDDSEYLKFALKVWRHIKKVIKSYPRYKRIKALFEFDTDQFVNAVRYANIVYEDYFVVNEKEDWLYLPHSMQILIDFDLDLMCGKGFNEAELGVARQIVLTLQEMGRIGNWVSTWEREVDSNDYTSATVAYAVNNNYLDVKDLGSKDKNVLKGKIRKSAAEKQLLKDWERKYQDLVRLSKNCQIIERSRLLEKSRYLIKMHIISKGYK